jgi:transposase InsO family protein
MRYAFIRAHAAQYAITQLCRVLQVKRASYYAWVKRGISQRAQRTAALTMAVEVAFRASGSRYGSPRVQAELLATGQRHSRKRIARIMQQHGWRAKTPRRYRMTTDSRHDHDTDKTTRPADLAGGEVAAVLDYCRRGLFVGDVLRQLPTGRAVPQSRLATTVGLPDAGADLPAALVGVVG